MKKTQILMLMALLVSCDRTEILFTSATGGGEFVSDKQINLKTNQSRLIEQRLVIKDSIILYSKNKIITLTNPKTTYKNAQEGIRIMKGYDFDSKSDKSIRLIYVDWRSPNIKILKASTLMTGDYDAKADTVDVYYTQIK